MAFPVTINEDLVWAEKMTALLNHWQDESMRRVLKVPEKYFSIT